MMRKYLFLIIFLVACGTSTNQGGPSDLLGPKDTEVTEDSSKKVDVPPGDVQDVLDQIGDSQDNYVDTSKQDAVDVSEDSGPVELKLERITPITGKTGGGDKVHIFGQGFLGNMMVTFGGVPAAKVAIVQKNELEVTTPPHPPETVDVVAMRADGVMDILHQAFTFYSDVRLESCNPSVVPVDGHVKVLLQGQGFKNLKALWVGDVGVKYFRVLDDTRVEFIAPAHKAGQVDVVARSDSGVGTGHNILRYVDKIHVDYVDPPVGPLQGGNTAVIYGKGLDSVKKLYFGVNEVQITKREANKLTVVVPAGDNAGFVDIVLNAYNQNIVIPGAYRYLSEQSTNKVLGIYPMQGPVSGGNDAIVFVDWKPSDPEVSFGSKDAQVIDKGNGFIHVKVPANTAGFVDVDVTDGQHSGTLTNGYRYVVDFSVLDIRPHSGPTSGGTEVTIYGKGLTKDCSVLFDNQAAKNCQTVQKGLKCVTPPHKAGMVGVNVVCNGVSAPVSGGFTYVDTPHIDVLTPNEGATTGGTLVHIYGKGLKQPLEVLFGDNPASHIQVLSPDEMILKTPLGKIGPVDVLVRFSDKNVQILPKAFVYFEPVAGDGGTWGGGFMGTLNVVVLDAGTGKGLPDAYVIVGSDPSTPYQGYTDEHGRISFSGQDLKPPLTVSANKDCYTNESVVDFDSTNVTLALTNLCSQGGGMPPGISPSIIKGRMSGLGKYVIPPVADCLEIGTASDGINCRPCFFDDECGSNGKCEKMGSYGYFCATKCTKPSDCPGGWSCAQVGPKEFRCLPVGGEKIAQCSATIPSPYMKNPFKPVQVQEYQQFTVKAIPGECALVCVGGTYDPILNRFTPIAMGVKRHILLQPGQTVTDVNVVLNIPLTKQMKFRLDHPPLKPHGPDVLAALIYYDFGNEGVFQDPELPYAFSNDIVVANHLPESLTGPLEGVSYTMLAGAFSTKGNTMSLVQIRNLKDLEDDVFFRFNGDKWFADRKGLTKEIYGVWGLNENEIWLVGEKGAIYVYDGEAFQPQQGPVYVTLRDIWGFSHNDIWAVGDSGVVLHFDGTKWTQVKTSKISNYYNLTTVFGSAPDDLYVGTTFSLFHYDGTAWTRVSHAPSTYVGRCIGSKCYVAGAFGEFGTVENGQATTININTNRKHIKAMAILNNRVFLGGEEGFLGIYDEGKGLTKLNSFTDQDLNTAIVIGNSVYFLGNNGTIVKVDEKGHTTRVFVDHYKPDIMAAYADKKSGKAVAFGVSHLFLGPLLDTVEPVYPKDGQLMDKLQLDFDFKDHPEASIMYIDIAIPGLFGDTTIWTLLANGQTHHVDLPEFSAIEGTQDIPPGQSYHVTVERIFIPEVSVDDFDYMKLHPMFQRAWSVTQWTIKR